jgi:hypothetical protein
MVLNHYKISNLFVTMIKNRIYFYKFFLKSFFAQCLRVRDKSGALFVAEERSHKKAGTDSPTRSR